MKKSTYIYKSFERFWHWSQALLILFLAVTGFEIHSSFKLFGFEHVVQMHNIAAWAFLILIIFAIFWHFVSGEWRQYIPTTKLIKEQVNYYVLGIFKGAPHPTKKTVYNKFNPLQRIIYLGLKILVIPIQVVSGFAFLYYIYPDSFWHSSEVKTIALVHTMGAFSLIAFVIAHIYLTTTGHSPTQSLYAMLTGWENLDVDETEFRKEHMVKAVENSVAGYYRIDKNGIITDANKAWLDMYKCTDKSYYLGQHYRITRTDEQLAQLESFVDKAFKGENTQGVVTSRKCCDGSIEKHILSMNPIYHDEEVVEVEGFIIDLVNAQHETDYMPYVIQEVMDKFDAIF